MVMRLSRQVQFFYEFAPTKCNLSKSQLTKQKQASKKQQRATVFRCTKCSKRGKIVYFAFLKKNQNCLDTLIYYTTVLCSLNFAVVKWLLVIYENSQDSMAWSSRQATSNVWDFYECKFKSSERQIPWLWNSCFKRGLRHTNRTYHYTFFVDCCDSDK